MITLDLSKPVPLPLQILEGGRSFKLLEAIRVNLGTPKAPMWLEIPAGFETDFASIPPEAGILGFEKLGAHSFAALIHDYLYTCQVGFELANTVFYESMRKSGVGSVRAKLMALATEAGGKSRYKAYAANA